MFYLAHLGDDAGAGNQFLRCVPAGENQFDVSGPFVDEINRAFKGNQVAVKAIVDLIEDDEVVLTRGQRRLNRVHLAGERRRHGRHVFRDVLAF